MKEGRKAHLAETSSSSSSKESDISPPQRPSAYQRDSFPYTSYSDSPSQHPANTQSHYSSSQKPSLLSSQKSKGQKTPPSRSTTSNNSSRTIRGRCLHNTFGSNLLLRKLQLKKLLRL